ncbi:MAG: hypothetical protein ACFFF4_17730, partial [Candidatus Thorarchaeota archaeon]
VTSKPIALFDESTQKKLLHFLEDIESLIDLELELLDEPGQVVLDVVNPVLSESFLSQIPILIGGDAGFDLISLNKTEQGRPLMKALSQQRRIIPSVRVYSDPKNADKVRSRFEKLFPSEEKDYREDEFDFSEY